MGYLLVTKIELSTRFAQRLLQGSILCTIVFVRILFGVMYRVESQMLKFLNFADDSSLLRKNVARQRGSVEEQNQEFTTSQCNLIVDLVRQGTTFLVLNPENSLVFSRVFCLFSCRLCSNLFNESKFSMSLKIVVRFIEMFTSYSNFSMIIQANVKSSSTYGKDTT